jgi:hypothetical protein
MARGEPTHKNRDEHTLKEDILHNGVDALAECRVLKAEVHRQIGRHHHDQYTHHP